MSKSRWASVLVLGVLGSVLLVSIAAAKVTGVRSTVTISSGTGDRFAGKVSAAKKKCRADRTVRLFTEGDSARPGDVLVDVTKTDASGAWRMDGNFLAGVYYAQVVALMVMIDGDPYRCAGDLSVHMQY